MDNKRLLIVMLIAVPLVLLWQPAIVWVGRQMGYDMTPKPPTTQVATTQSAIRDPAGAASGDVEAATQSSSQPAGRGVSSGPIRVLPADAGRTSVPLGSALPDDPIFSMGVTLSPRGASIDRVVLNRYKKSVESPDRYVFQRPYENFEEASRPLASGEVIVTLDGVQSKIDLSKVDWSLQESSAGKAVLASTSAARVGRRCGRLRRSRFPRGKR